MLNSSSDSSNSPQHSSGSSENASTNHSPSLPLGLSNKTEDPTHPVKSTKPEPSVVQPDYLEINSESLPSQPNFDGLSGESSLPNSIHLTQLSYIIFSQSSVHPQFLSSLILSQSLVLTHSFDLSTADLRFSSIYDSQQLICDSPIQNLQIFNSPPSSICDSPPSHHCQSAVLHHRSVVLHRRSIVLLHHSITDLQFSIADLQFSFISLSSIYKYLCEV